MTGHTPFKPKMETAPPDISAYREGNTGIGFVSTFDSGRPGPHVMVNALTHGNEFCGAHALIFLFQQGVRPAHNRHPWSPVGVVWRKRKSPGRRAVKFNRRRI